MPKPNLAAATKYEGGDSAAGPSESIEALEYFFRGYLQLELVCMYVLSFLFPLSLLSSDRPGRDRKNCTNQLNKGRGDFQKTE
jgi:hypothetical protein